uniref:UL16 binding protein 3 n=1 Tax=Bos taurus TaxID=9913 RepID=A0AAA9T5L7_BOVIN
TDAHSLSYNITIDPRPRDGQPWCEVQGEVDQKVFLSYDCGRAKIKYMSPLGEEVKSMNAWEAQTDTLRDIGDLLKEQMTDVTPEKHLDKGPLTLQARMSCWQEDNGLISASWEFGFNGQLCLLFDSESGYWTMVHSKGRWMKEKWENDRAVTEFFKKVSRADCQRWYQDFLLHWEKMLKTTASPTTGPSTMQRMAPDSSYSTWIATGVLAGFVITIIIIACIHYKKRRRCSQEA